MPKQTLNSLMRRTWLFGLLALPLIASCGGPPPKPPNPTKPVSELRAKDIIAKAMKREKLTPQEGRDVPLTSGATVKMDVGVEGSKFGVAYVTEMDLAQPDASKLPQKDKTNPKALVLGEGTGKEIGTRVLILYASDYLYDDHVGEEHEQTAMAAEAAIERDTLFFLVNARTQKWP